MLVGALAKAVTLWKPEQPVPDDDFTAFIDAETEFCKQVYAFLEKLEHTAVKEWQAVYDSYAAWNEQAAQENEQDGQQPTTPCPQADGVGVLEIAPDGLTAWLMVLPPVGDGIPLSPYQASKLLKEGGVTYGIVPGACESAAIECFKVFTVAVGTPATDGIDGDIEDLFARETPEPRQSKISETHEQTVNYRDREWLVVVKRNQTLCNLTQPVAGIVGTNVMGKEIIPKEGRMPVIPEGKNTYVNDEQTKLLAQCDGRLVFQSGKFAVETKLVINENINYNIGNIAMPGDLVIRGTVEPGFTIYAKGTLTVEGVVENAYLSAQGDIHLLMGVKGDGGAVVESGGNIDCKFAENSTLRAQGSISAEYLINCSISARDDIIITRGKGVLIGGSARLGRRLEVRAIGNATNRPISISMGMDPDLLQSIQQDRKNLEKMQTKVRENDKNIAFLEKRPALDEVYTQLLKQLKLDRTVLMMKIAKLQKGIEAKEALFDPDSCEIVAETIYPPASIQMGSSVYQLQKQWNMSKVVLRNGDIVVVPQA